MYCQQADKSMPTRGDKNWMLDLFLRCFNLLNMNLSFLYSSTSIQRIYFPNNIPEFHLTCFYRTSMFLKPYLYIGVEPNVIDFRANVCHFATSSYKKRVGSVWLRVESQPHGVNRGTMERAFAHHLGQRTFSFLHMYF